MNISCSQQPLIVHGKLIACAGGDAARRGAAEALPASSIPMSKTNTNIDHRVDQTVGIFDNLRGDSELGIQVTIKQEMFSSCLLLEISVRGKN